jgi:GTP cyclohydrolase I
VFARRPQVQERLTSQIADALVEHLEPRGVVVIVEAEHMCMKMRGVNKAHSAMMTTAYRGELKDNADMRYEVQSLILQSRQAAGQTYSAGCGC